MADITMPQLGETVTEGTITKWHKQVGDPVAEDDVLFEVSTDKVDSEVPSPVSGVLSEILVAEGDTVDVGTRLAVIASGAEAGTKAAAGAGSADAPADSGRGPGGGSSEAPSTPADQPAGAEWPAPAPADDLDEPAAPGRMSQPDLPAAAQQPAQAAASAQPGPAAAAETGTTPEQVRGAARTSTGAAGPGGRVPAAPPSGGGESQVLSPVVRRLISEHQLDPSQIQGTGAGGRITRSDVLALIDRRNGGRSAGQPTSVRAGATLIEDPQTLAGPPAPASATPASASGDRDTVVPFTNIRRRTAEHMVRSKATSAHTMVAVEVDYSGVERVRQAQKERFRQAEGFALTFLPFVTRAVVDALASFPNVNSSVGEDSLVVHHDVNIGIAVDLDFEGLLVPVIHQADGKRLRMLAREISELASKARSKRLTMDDISGGTFTITNAGPFGTFITVPVINQPQVAILSTDGVRKRPVAVELDDGSDGIAIHPVGNLVMSWDHRAFDGAYAAAFLRDVKTTIESRDWSAEL